MEQNKDENKLQVNYRETRKFNEWLRYFLESKNRETYGNATQSALKVYGASSYDSAASIGHQNFKKLQFLSVKILDIEGFGFADLMKIIPPLRRNGFL